MQSFFKKWVAGRSPVIISPSYREGVREWVL
jgi:hypothetical protein